jgi:hypothetical protein
MKRYLIPAAIIVVLAIALIATPILANNGKANTGCCADQAALENCAAACDPNVPCAIPGCPAVADSVAIAELTCAMTDCPMEGSIGSVNQNIPACSPGVALGCPMMASTPAANIASPVMPAGSCCMIK